MSESELVAFLNAFYLFSFAVGVFIATGRLLARVFQYRRAKWKLPLLLPRDLFLFTGFGITLGLIFTARVFGFGIYVRDELWWSILTGSPIVLGVWIWLYYEFFKIDKRGGHESELYTPPEEGNPEKAGEAFPAVRTVERLQDE